MLSMPPEGRSTDIFSNLGLPRGFLMSDDRVEEVKKNILSPSQWVRILYMAFYAVVCWVLSIVLIVIIVAQVLISLITGGDNENLRTVGKRVSDYFHNLFNYLVYATDDKPWPFEANEGASTVTQTDVVGGDAGEEYVSSGAKQAGGEDVFADISFTDSADDDADEISNENEEAKAGDESKDEKEDSNDNESGDDRKDQA